MWHDKQKLVIARMNQMCNPSSRTTLRAVARQIEQDILCAQVLKEGVDTKNGASFCR